MLLRYYLSALKWFLSPLLIPASLLFFYYNNNNNYYYYYYYYYYKAAGRAQSVKLLDVGCKNTFRFLDRVESFSSSPKPEYSIII